MTHAKISPTSLDEFDRLDATRSALIVAEEMRVNLAVKGVGFDVDALVDGSEKVLGQRLAIARDWPNLVESIVSTAFTKGAREIVKGARSVDRDFGDRADQVRTLVETWAVDWCRGRTGRVAKKNVAERVAHHATSTRPIFLDVDTNETRNGFDMEWNNDAKEWQTVAREPKSNEVALPSGFVEFSLDLARWVDKVAGRTSSNTPPLDPTRVDDDATPTEEQLDGLDPTKSSPSKWARLVWDKSIPLNRNAKNALGRRRTSSDVGLVPRYADRWFSDPDRRIFSTTRRDVGGIVLIDQSGSMSLDQSELDAIVDASAGCVVIGYSHGRRAVGNIWLHANRGRVASIVRGGNGGNGCDRPALDYALSIRKNHEPIVWVCDGWVTYEHDGVASQADRLAILADIRKHGVHMVPKVDEAIDALRQARSGRLPAKYARELVTGIPTHEVVRVWGGAR